ncbi:hypothetical protein T10_5972 [Trichinella papuae]|uniref:Uncharacterized protein n=1 Tax=Trichinella papuae TaxID=268474 RepID=A0A0V1M9Q3_9BILA|nr:hypothetical protein T10_5972 [Trichinella papuae]
MNLKMTIQQINNAHISVVKSCKVSKTLHYNSGTWMHKSLITFLKNIYSIFAINTDRCANAIKLHNGYSLKSIQRKTNDICF